MDASMLKKGDKVYEGYVSTCTLKDGIPYYNISQQEVVGMVDENSVILKTEGGYISVKEPGLLYPTKADASAAVTKALRKFAAMTVDAANKVESDASVGTGKGS